MHMHTVSADNGLLNGVGKDADATTRIKEWDLHMDDIPNIINYLIGFFMQIATTVAIIFIIIWAYKILFWSMQQDVTKWRDTILMALGGFALASLAWVIVKFILDSFGNIS